MSGGRPIKLTPEIEQEITKAIRAGNYIETAAAYVGINKTTLYDWMKRGARERERLEKNPKAKIKKSEAPFVEFSNAVKKALAAAEMRDVQIIAKAAESNWQAAAWKLERRAPQRWGRKDRLQAEVEHSGEIKNTEEKNINITEQITVDEESKELLKQLWRRSMMVGGDRN
jgi:transposase